MASCSRATRRQEVDSPVGVLALPVKVRGTRQSNTNHQKVLDLWKGGSRRPGAIFESVEAVASGPLRLLIRF